MLGVTRAFATYWLLVVETTRSICVGRYRVADEEQRELPSRFPLLNSKERGAVRLPGTMLAYSVINIQHQRATVTLKDVPPPITVMG
jgi:hypothetical protein